MLDGNACALGTWNNSATGGRGSDPISRRMRVAYVACPSEIDRRLPSCRTTLFTVRTESRPRNSHSKYPLACAENAPLRCELSTPTSNSNLRNGNVSFTVKRDLASIGMLRTKWSTLALVSDLMVGTKAHSSRFVYEIKAPEMISSSLSTVRTNHEFVPAKNECAGLFLKKNALYSAQVSF